MSRRELLQMALDALEDYVDSITHASVVYSTIEALKAELAKPDEASTECWACKGTGIITTSSNGSGLIEDVCMACKEDV
jgi:DnaJ-class molecular chaperone